MKTKKRETKGRKVAGRSYQLAGRRYATFAAVAASAIRQSLLSGEDVTLTERLPTNTYYVTVRATAAEADRPTRKKR